MQHTGSPTLDVPHAPSPPSARSRADRVTWLAGTALTLGVAAALAPHGPAPVLLLLIALAAWFVAPGWLVIVGMHGRSCGAAWVLAPAVGYALSSLALLGAWSLGSRGVGAVLVAPLAAAVLAWPLGRLLRGHLDAPAWTRRDTRALLVLLLLVPAVVGWPYARVGAELNGGQLYRAYFTADFVWAMAAVAEVAKGALPPVNPFRAGSAMHYYWLAHLFPAVEYNALAATTALRHVLLANAVLCGLAFVSFLYGFARQFTVKSWAAAGGVAVAVLATSYEGLEQLVTLWSWGQPLSLVAYLNIDAITRWVHGGLPVDGLQRLLLYKPQHQLGYATALSALLVAHRARRAASWRLALACGTLLALSLLLSTFSALMLTVVVAIYLAVRLARERAWGAVVPMAMAGAAPLALAVVLSRALEYVEPGSAPIGIGLNRLAVRGVVPALGLGFGPFLAALLAFAWVVTKRREGRALAQPVAVVVGVCAFFYLYVDVRDHQDVYVAWRVGHVLFILLSGLAALVLARVADLRGARRWIAAGAAAVAILAALPTTLIDLYNTQDITNFAPGPGFPWTLHITADEAAALDWLRTETDPQAVVQVDPIARGAATWAYVPAFAERRMAAGLPISMIPVAGYERATQRVVRLFASATALDAAIECRRFQIDYVFIGPPERARHPGIESVLDAPGVFDKVLQNDTVTLYRFRDGRHALSRRAFQSGAARVPR